MKKLLLQAIVLLAMPFAGFSQCTTLNATSCKCADTTQTNCDLFPDITVSRAPLLINGSSGYTEYPQVCNPPCSGNDGRIRLSVSTPNIGHGPMETRGTPTYVCGTDTVTAANVASIPATCPVTGLPPRQLIVQRVYHKSGTAMTYTDRPAGTMTYHASHGHQHVDDWGEYTLRTSNGDPNPLNWPLVGIGAKLAFCLLDIGSCNGYPGYCVDSLGTTLNQSNVANYGLGGGNYGCSNVVQGISAGYLDIYSQGLDGMWINVPPGICNGNYWIVAQIDPHFFFSEEAKWNNVVAVPITLTQQGGTVPAISANGPTTFCTGGNVTLTSTLGTNYLWSNGETTQSIVVTQAGNYAVTINSGSSCPATSNSTTVTINNLSVSADATPGSACPGQPIQLSSLVNGSGTTLGPVPFTNNTVVSIPDNIATGASSSVTVSGIGPATLNANSIASVNINITHTYDADLTISLIAPSGNTINLSNSRGGSGDNFVNTVFVASGAPTIASGTAPFTGQFLPDGAFTSLTGNANGVWTLKVVDHAGQDVGTINNWTLTINNTIPSTYSYQWSSNPAGFTSALQNPIASPNSSVVYTVTATESGSGCTGTQTASVTIGSTINVTTNTPSAICSGESTLLTANGAATYSWSPATGLSATTGSSVTASPVETTTYLVIGNSGGCIDSAYVTVTVLEGPQITASPDQIICNGASVNLTVSGADTYSWSPVGTINPTTGASVLASPSATTLYTVTGTLTSNGCTSSEDVLVTVNNIPAIPLAVNGNSHNCLPLSNEIYNTSAVAGATSYLWTLPAGASFSGQGTTAISVNASTILNGNICVNASNGCGTSANICKPFTTQTTIPSTPGSVTGPTRVCPGEIVTFAVPSVSRATFYNWTLPAGVTINSGAGTNSINVTIGAAFTTSSLTVAAGNGCGVGGTRVRNLTLNTPSTPGTISGPSGGLCGSTQTFSVPAVAGMTYIWSVPAGATINGASNGNSISVTFNNAYVTGSITVKANNLCGNSGVRSKVVKGTTDQPAAINGATSVCTNQINVAYSIAPLPGAVTYLWTVPPGCTISSGQGTTSITVTMTGTPRTGNVTARGVNMCGAGTSRTRSITINNCPKFTDQTGLTQDLNVFPNPAHEYVEVIFNGVTEVTGKVRLLDILGKEKYSQQVEIQKGHNSYVIDVRKLAPGVYLVRLEQDGKKFTQKLIVN